jgi:hypothetical protein
MTNQPKWKAVATIGDVNPIEYGGGFVLTDKTGVYPPEIELIEPPADDDERGPLTVYRIVMEPHTYVNDVLSDNEFHPDHPVWYADKIESVADSVGCEPEELIGGLCSDSPIERALAYRDLIGYFGPHEFDSYPLTLTRSEAKRRYRKAQYRIG